MRYLVTARVKPGRTPALARGIDDGTLGRGSIAGDEYLRNMESARKLEDGRVQWVEVCYCATPLAEEREYREEYFTLDKVQDAHARSRCRDLNGTEPWACGNCDCSAELGGAALGTQVSRLLDFWRTLDRRSSGCAPRAARDVRTRVENHLRSCWALFEGASASSTR